MLRKIINVLLVVIIPLLAAFAVGLYGYNRYDVAFTVKAEKKGYYDSRIEEKNSESEILAYLDFYTSYYEEIYSNDVKSDSTGKDLFTLKGYATYYQTYKEDGEVNTKTLNYMFFAYNINYGNLYKEIYKNNKNELGAYVPTLNVTFIDHDTIGTDSVKKKAGTFAPINSVELIDHNWVGYTKEDGTKTQKNSNNERITFTDTIGQNKYFANVKVATFSIDKEYSSNLDLEISTTDPQYSSYDESTVVVSTISLQNIIQRAKYFDINGANVKQGYEEDIYKAGYFKYAFGRYLWWEGLIALVLTLIVTGATVIVWNISDDKFKTSKK